MSQSREAQSEAPSVDELDKILYEYAMWRDNYYQDLEAGVLTEKEWIDIRDKVQSEAKAKINRLIGDAYNKGYSDGRLVKPKYKVGDISGNYRITERFRRVGKNTKYKVVCILCDAPMFRYSNKFNLKHKECGAIKND